MCVAIQTLKTNTSHFINHFGQLQFKHARCFLELELSIKMFNIAQDSTSEFLFFRFIHIVTYIHTLYFDSNL